MGFSDLATAAGFRDVIENITRGVIRSERPEGFLAKVYDIDVSAQKARVMRVGDDLNSLTPVSFALDKIPSVVMGDLPLLGTNAPADVVRVMRMGGTYYIADFVYGAPLPQVPIDSDILHANPSFEDPRFIDGVPIRYMARSYLQSGNWSMSLDNKVKTHGNFALKIFRGGSPAATARIDPEHAYPVLAGDTVRVSCWTKTNPSGQLMDIGVYTGSSEGAAQLFGGGGAQSKTFVTTDYWVKYSSDFVIPTGHTWVRPEWFPWTIGSNDITMWLDDTRMVRQNYTPWIPFDGSASGSSSIYSSFWQNYGSSFTIPRFRKVDDVVEIEGLAQVLSGGGLTVATLPVGYRPAKYDIFTVVLNSSSVTSRLDVQADGQIVLASAVSAGGFYPLNGIRFSTL